MSPRTRITNNKLSIRVCTLASTYGFKTIGSFHKFLKQCQPNAKLYLGIGHTRVSMLLREIERELAS